MIEFQQIFTADNETAELFATCSDNFITDYDEQEPLFYLEKMINHCKGHFWKCFVNGEFSGCIFFYGWKFGNVVAGGFSKRKLFGATSKGFNQICTDYLKAFNLYQIKSETRESNKSAQICLKRAGFSYETTLKNESLKNGKPVSYKIYSLRKESINV